MAIYKDPLLTGSHMATQQYQSNAATPNEEDANAGLFRDIREAFGAQPRGINALGAGFVRGLEHGATISSIQNRKKDLEKYNKVMDYFQEVGNEAIERNQQEEKMQYAKKSTLPQAIEYLRNISKYDSISKKEAMQLMASNFGRMIGKDIKIDAVADGDPTSATASIDGQSSFFSLYDIFPEEIIQAEAAKSMPSYQLEQQRARQQQAFENNLAQQKLNILQEGMFSKNETQNRRIEETSRRNDQMERKSDIHLNETIGKKLDAERHFLEIAPRMKKIVTDHPDIFQSALQVAFDSEGNADEGYIKQKIRSLISNVSPEKADAITQLVKNINKMTLDVANDLSRPNIFIEKIGSKAVPNLNMTPQGFLNELDHMVNEKTQDMKNNLKRLELLESQTSGLSKQYQESYKIPSDKIRIKLPDGSMGIMSREEYNARR